jgi:hypothetical protein
MRTALGGSGLSLIFWRSEFIDFEVPRPSDLRPLGCVLAPLRGSESQLPFHLKV